MNIRLRSFLLLAFIVLLTGCANQTTPTGGKKDITPPKLLSATPADSLRNTKVKKLELVFDEYVTVNDAVKEVQVSPILSIQPTIIGNGKKVTLKIVDSLLEENTTYRISLGTAIRDLHESNIFPNYTYTFSTGAYFDSLAFSGRVINAGTGLADTAGNIVVLYNAADNDSAIVRHKPKYMAKVDGAGHFSFKGLPKRSFRVYAIKDANDNLLYDGAAENVAFNNTPITPGDTTRGEVVLRLFAEEDTSYHKETKPAGGRGRDGIASAVEPAATDGKTPFSYSVGVDTGSVTKRVLDITRPLDVTFSHTPVLNKDKITLAYDSSGVMVASKIEFVTDTAHPGMLHINAAWKENTLYTLRFAKGFAKDTSGAELMPSKYIFRTKEAEDYGKITVHLPTKYYGNEYLLQVVADKDTIYQKPVADTVVTFTMLRPGKYSFTVINDKNGNRKWDSGNLFLKLQPEEVYPYSGTLFLKPGWENIIDFEQNPKARR